MVLMLVVVLALLEVVQVAVVLIAFSLLLIRCMSPKSSNAALVRKSVEHLTPEDILNLQKSLRDVNDDDSQYGYAAIAAYHGYPSQCKDGDRDVACCIHGMSVFPQWHRLYVVQMEQALKEKGLSIGVPYWDWTRPLNHLPELVSQQVFIDSDGGKARGNVWYQGDINIDGHVVHTARAVDERLFQQVEAGERTDLFEQVLNALEYENYCQFEVQFEVAHNTIHYLVGGRHTYSMSHLEYTSYDPIFFLHHSNVDRIYAVYEELQKLRGNRRGKYRRMLCDIAAFQKELVPFNWDSNPFPLTKRHNKAYEVIDHSLFGYRYDDLTLNGMDLETIKALLKEKQTHDRAFASFRLAGIGGSANVRVEVCVPGANDVTGDYCEFAGDFFILGGPTEMAWTFTWPYFFDITKTVQHMGIDLEGDYHVQARIFSVNGTELPSDLIPSPSVSFRPALGKTDRKWLIKILLLLLLLFRYFMSSPFPSVSIYISFFVLFFNMYVCGSVCMRTQAQLISFTLSAAPISHHDDAHEHEFQEGVAVRKDISRLTREEVYELRQAMQKFQNDASVDGYQATAEFHGDPGKCPYPSAKNRLACCIHGMPTFPHWHRLFVVQVEDALRRRGAHIGMPYWDWTKPKTTIPALAADESYVDPTSGESVHNPFYNAQIAFLGNGVVTSRDVLEGLTQTPTFGDHTDLFDAYLLALEQDNFCDFEVQFEVAHNMIHALVGGNAPFGLASLSYSAYDPIFFLHHSNVDRIWAIWTALQQHRGKPYKAHCAQSYVHQPMKPFAFSSPLNNNEKTFSHSVPTNVYDYEKELGYAYDSLHYGGMGIAELDSYINENLKGKSRTFVGILLHGIKKSAIATVFVNAPGKEKYNAGQGALLGGPSEMAWGFDRLYRHDITDAMSALGLHWSSPFEVSIEMHEFDGTPVDVSEFPRVQLIHKNKQDDAASSTDDIIVRKNVNDLNAEEVVELRRALANLQEDKSAGGFQDLGRYHGTPKWCPAPDAEKKVACCVHGMPVFPHWHRLLAVQTENALRRHGYTGALPYWDWTRPMTSLPSLVDDALYVDPSNGKETRNPFYSGHIDDVDQYTVRSVRDDLYQQPNFGDYTDIAKQVLLALEQDDFCTFEVQYEIAHNFIHALVGGSEQFSMASLQYTAFDPIFFLHHSNTDRLWAIWQALQKYRGKPYNTANCAIGQLRNPLSPFSLTSDINPDPVTREHSIPFQAFDYRSSFHYDYDNLEFNGLTVPQLARVLEQNKAEDRVFAGFMLHGIQQSALIKFYICKGDDCNNYAGEFYVLGDVNEMAWSYDRLYKYEITDALKALGLKHYDRYSIRYEILDLHGNDIGQLFPTPTVVFEMGTSHLYGQEYREAVTTASQVRRDLSTLNEGEVESLRAAFLSIQKDDTYANIAAFHGKPGLCELNGRKVACCVHGMATFPAWHRLYVEQVEEALLGRGSNVAVPYWDWTKPITELPKLINDATYFNSRTQKFEPNPFFSGKVLGEDAVTTRDPQAQLFNNDHFYQQTLFALEQTNFCDFEIQFELIHNALHSWLGGRAEYSFSSLDYTAFDPVFFLHHANTDRIWAIWQELQRYRGLPYNEADCAINLMRKPLQPFNNDELNHGDLTSRYSRPADTFDYRNHFQYEYDTLTFNHMTIPQLENLLHQRQENGRVFAGFLLHNIGASADVEIYICVPTGPRGKKNCGNKAGVFSVLGGQLEMPFVFDRLYKYDITHAVRDLGLKLDNAANFELKIDIRAVNGSFLSPSILPSPTVFYVPGSSKMVSDERQESDGQLSSYQVRKSIDALSPQEELSLLKAMAALQADSSADGYQSIASFHAIPPLCPSPSASKRYACCLHGMATFPQWHRLYTVQVEDALRRHGSLVGIPYWDWSRQTDHLPGLLANPTYTDVYTGQTIDNPWYKARIEFENTTTERDVQGDYLFKQGPHGFDTWLFNQALLALEQEDYCDFEIQFEITHNAVHSWLGGTKVHSMGHLHYASYDPAFYVHHSNTDRLWALWQALQKYRGHNPNEANCALEQMREPLKPFSFGSPYNLNEMTKEYSKPEDTFDYEGHFNYRYDNLEFVGMNIPRLDAFIKERRERSRVFAGFLLKGFGSSAMVTFDICTKGMESCFQGGYFTVLGGAAEMPWQFDRLFKYEITDQDNLMFWHFCNTKPKGFSSILSNLALIFDRSFLLKGFGSSAFVNFDIVSNGKSFEGGYFTVLGGSAEMPWQFDRLFKYEITDQLIAANLRFDDNYSFNISVRLPDGTVLDSSLIPTPSVLFKSAQHDFKREHVAPNHVRRNLDTLEERDLQSLKAALRDLQHDNSNDGWASLASFHGSPAKCSTPANESVACCIHGMPTFPHWHRLFTLQVEQALRRHGSAIAIPYWDWTLPITDLPEIFTSQNYYDVWRDEVVNNPFARGYVPTEDVYTVRDIRPEIRNKNQAGDHSAIFDLVLSALEQTDYCDFEVQFEVMHNAIHFLVGGLQTYSLSSLEYSAYDPLFFIHHSFTDKIWAVWQELQTRRHLPANKADCALNYMSQPMRPFFFEGFNLNKFTMDHAVPNTVFDYEHLGYSYDDLSIGGYDLDGLEQVIADRQSKARVFAGFLLKGVKTSGSVVINICLRNNVCNYAGRFNLLGGPTEMAWAFDRLFTYDITSALEQSGINPEDVFDAEALFTLDIKVFDVEGHALPVSSVLPEPTIIYKAAVGASEEVSSSSSLAGVGVRKDVSTLSTSEIDNLREALRRVQADAGPNGFASIAAFHGEPAGCELNGRRIACCQHGMANFPQWHRLFVKQFEDALTAQGAMIGIPYWDWTTAFTALPSLVTEQENNPFYNFKIFNGEVTSRAPREQLFNDPYHKFTQTPSQVEQALRRHGSAIAIPYWDWTQPISHLPEIFTSEDFYDVWRDEVMILYIPLTRGLIFYFKRGWKRLLRRNSIIINYGYSLCSLPGLRTDQPISICIQSPQVVANPFARGYIPTEKAYTVRDVRPEIHLNDREGRHSALFDLVLLALEQTDYCDFEVQFEVMHNAIHFLVGGLQTYSMSTLEYSAYDPMFLIHHSFTDKIWIVWQELQKRRHLPATSAACAVNYMNQPMKPFYFEGFNLNGFTKEVEQALRRHGSAIAIPYWDWTLPITDLPEIFTSEDFYDVWRDEVVNNPFARGYVPTEDVYTVRDIRPEIRNKNQAGDHSAIFDLVLSALEQTDYCDFEVQFEITHNAMHFLVGGLQTYSLSSLEYSAYDPMFLIHHSYTDKIWALWQALQTRRHLPANKAACAVNYMSQPMRPFFFEGFNLNKFTMDHAVPNTVFDYEHLGYSYDDLSIGGYDLDGLEQVIADRQSKARVFAGFLLKGVKTSGSVVINICLRNNVCNYAGRFNLLGGPTEMAWAFDRLFTYDITSALEQSGINPEDVFDAEALFTLDIKVFDVEGHALPVSSVLPEPTIIYKAAVGASEEVSSSSSLAGVGVRKDVSTLSTSEIDNLREALRRVQADAGPNGFASIAAFHGEPAGCELNGRRIACCQHGMANFPQWHRLFVKQFEDALTAQGAMIGIPYWDWTTAFTALPSLVTEQENNPFYNFKIFNGEVTSRAPREQLFNDPEFGSESFFYRQALLAFEQTDYCDFEVQYEITHNAIHSWTGGRSPYGMSTLEFTAYDPLFLLHHSNADRQFAIWQALQKFRGLPYNNANCAIQKLREPMKPFSNLDNINPTTRANARAIDAFDYDRFNYQYDNLNFHGLTISELNDLLEKRKEEDRVFAEFLLAGFGGSGDVVFNLCSEEECAFAGTFAVLGGAIEMPWAFDRLFKYDVTNVFRKLNLRPDDVYHFEVKIVAVNGTELYPGLIRPPSVQFVPGVKGYYERVAAKTAKSSASLLRKDVNDLTLAEASNLRDALYKLQQDQGPNGFEAIAGYHGAPFKCPANGEDKYACCAHGMPVFPHWHRLHTVQFEQALKEHGALVGVPYWDWTAPINALPSLIGDSSNHNPFYKYHISFVNQPNNECAYGGRFNVLGGPLEMDWAFNRLFKFDITRALEEAGLHPEDVFDSEALFTLRVKIFNAEGQAVALKSVMPEPTIIFEPAHGAAEDVSSTTLSGVGVRKDVSTLSAAEISNLRDALRKVQADVGPNGFASIAAFHGEPAGCELNGHPIACCQHGMANFPQWHRLFVKQFEDALTAQGAMIGIPYWDWTTAFTALPSLVTEQENNPFYNFKIFNGEVTSRAPREQLFNDPEFGSESFFYRQALLAFEQTDYCDFEVSQSVKEAMLTWFMSCQRNGYVIHQRRHFFIMSFEKCVVPITSPKILNSDILKLKTKRRSSSLSFSLHQVCYDHCNATWDGLMCWSSTPAGQTAEQKCPAYVDNFYRHGALYSPLERPLNSSLFWGAVCCFQKFFLGKEVNYKTLTTLFQKYTYMFRCLTENVPLSRFNYQYDNLNFHGLTISELNDLLEKRKEEDRIFAEFLLAGFGGSADVIFNLCSETECTFAGTFAVLGGAIEMPWAFDRLFKYDVTNVFMKLNLRPDDVYHFEVEIVAVNGTHLDSGLIRPPSVQFVPGVKAHQKQLLKSAYPEHQIISVSVPFQGYYERVAAKTAKSSANLLRKDVNDLTLAEVSNLRDALYKMQQDQGPNGFEAIAGYHGAPFKCPAEGADKYACCAHGMPIFPHWHRLHTVQFEQSLKEHGALVGVPYWDWTAPINALPSLIGDSSNHNPFYKSHISFVNKVNNYVLFIDTTRDIQDSLFNPRTINGYNYLYYLALSTLEEDNFCDFEIQYEVLHNEIHGLIGGHGTYSMSTLDYSAFDPLFMIHHSSIDRIWAIWQQLQKLRRKPFNSARCGGAIMEEPLQPFSYSQVNTNDFTRMNSLPSKVFDYAHLGYEFDDLDLNGHSVEDLNGIIGSFRDQNRIYIAFNNYGRQNSFTADIYLMMTGDKKVNVGRFYMLGGEREMPWSFERLFKYDITDIVRANHVDISKPVKLFGQLITYDGAQTKNLTSFYSMFVERPAGVDHDILNIPILRDNTLSSKIVLKKGTRIRFITEDIGTPMENLGSFTNFHFCNIPPFSYHSFPFGEVHALSPGDYFFVNRDSGLCNSGRRLQITVTDE
ncbi:hemocyanin 2 [Aplysia californica]|uniref:Hemocyanin 2 n=1 Tax=Aplysia californica TaxID=6500 RepID=A0ABM1VUI0_APLCA|nr:hemocyanin 2 [Aplysia californica]